MKWEQQCQQEIEMSLDQYFPKMDPPQDSGRAKALVIFAIAMGFIRKTIRAFGGCELCWGKGYSTQTIDGKVQMNFCTCIRGKDLHDLLQHQYGHLS